MSKIPQTQALKRECFEEPKKGPPMLPDSPGGWKHLAEQASAEMNSEKPLELVNELNQLLGEREDKPRQQRHQGNQL